MRGEEEEREKRHFPVPATAGQGQANPGTQNSVCASHVERKGLTFWVLPAASLCVCQQEAGFQVESKLEPRHFNM